jgi:hypothetical protein
MRTHRSLWVAVGILVLGLAVAPASHAQLNSAAASVNLNAVLSESLTVTAGPGVVNFTLVGAGMSNGSSTVTIDTTWALSGARSSVTVSAYFSSGVALTDGSGNDIPAANVEGSVNGGGFASFTAAGPFSAFSQQVMSVAITDANRNGASSDTLDLRINTAGLGLPAGTYTGVLNIQAQAI